MKKDDMIIKATENERVCKFYNIVSLGHFCSPAIEFERIERRGQSLPFDWLITPQLEIVMMLISNYFEDFLNPDYFYQLRMYPQYYRNVKWNIDFYHDFSPLKPFSNQYQTFVEKYSRRIARFYKTISSPTLFVRYVTAEDIPFILEHQETIVQQLKSFHPDNKIIYISNSDQKWNSDGLPVYFVERDADDTVSRHFLKKNPALLSEILACTAPRGRQPFVYVVGRRITHAIYRCICKVAIKLGWVYYHNKTI